MKPLVLYHANCADGFGAAFAAWLKLGDDAEYRAVSYGEDLGLDSPNGANTNTVYWNGRVVYILDFSLPREQMDTLFSITKKVIWLDHHKTAMETYLEMHPSLKRTYNTEDDTVHYESYGISKIILDNNKSGAMISWEYFHPDKEVPMLIKHIDDYDRWQFRIEGTKEFSKALWSYAPWSFADWNHWLKTSENSVFGCQAFYSEGAAILRAHNQNVQSVVKGSTQECWIGYSRTKINPIQNWESFRGLAANCPPHLSSDVGHELANQSGTFGLVWHMDKDGKIKCSLRSNGDYDVSAIAKALGGGGHRNAAGFETDIQTLLEWMK